MPITFSTAKAVPADADVLAVPVFAGRRIPAGTSAELDMGFLEARGFEGRAGETLPLLADDGTTVLAVGLGEESAVDVDVIRRAAATMVRASWHATRLATTLLTAVPVNATAAAA